jgi:hypothetical protein
MPRHYGMAAERSLAGLFRRLFLISRTASGDASSYFSNTFSTWPTFFWTLPVSFSS